MAQQSIPLKEQGEDDPMDTLIETEQNSMVLAAPHLPQPLRPLLFFCLWKTLVKE